MNIVLAIHKIAGSFSDRWISYCNANNITYKEVDCYRSDIVQQLVGTHALLWHYHHNSPKDIIFAKQFLFALEHSGYIVFPEFNAAWHFDDKIGQKYLLESLDLPFAETFVSYNKEEALQWSDQTSFPRVFKLRGGAGSSNVRLVKSKSAARKIINRAFNKGFSSFDPKSSFIDRWRNYKKGKTNIFGILKGLTRFLVYPKYAIVKGREMGYVYFQEFISDNDGDIRIIIVGDKAFAINRINRENDFRASGSGHVLYDKEIFSKETISLAFEVAHKMKASVVSIDFLYKNGSPRIVEVSYGFTTKVYDACQGYWDINLNWYAEKIDPHGWMIEEIIKEIKSKSKEA